MVKVLDRSESGIIVKLDKEAIFALEDAGLCIDDTFSAYDISFTPGIPAKDLLASFDR